MHLAGPVLLLIHLAALVAADTEIVNFRSGQIVSRALAVGEFSPVLTSFEPSFVISTTPSPSEGNTGPTGYQELDGLCKIKAANVQKAHEDANDSPTRCPGDTWVILNTGAQGWGFDRLTTLIMGRGNEPFTLRASWAASTPAEVSLRLFCFFGGEDNINGSTPAPCTTGRYAARVRVTNGKFTKVPNFSSFPMSRQNGTSAMTRTPHPVGLLFPGRIPKWLNPPPVHVNRNTTISPAARHDTLDVHLVLEPLLLGVFPRSLLPWLGMLLCVVGMGLFIAPPVIDWFIELAQDVKLSEKKKGI